MFFNHMPFRLGVMTPSEERFLNKQYLKNLLFEKGLLNLYHYDYCSSKYYVLRYNLFCGIYGLIKHC